MNNLTWQRRLPWVGVIVALLMLAGCTKDKALALKAAAEAFRDSAVRAIENYETLMVNGVLGTERPESEQFQQVLKELKETGAVKRVSPDDALKALSGLDSRERALQSVQVQLADVRAAYVAYAASLARLPEGSFLAGDAVACAAGLGVRLTKRMADFAQTSKDRPVRYQYRFGKALDSLNRALAAKNDEDVQRAVGELVETRNAERRDNAVATALFVEAVGAGLRTVSLAQSYSELSVEDLLSGLNQILEIRGAIFEIDPTNSLKRLATYQAKLEQDPLLKPILSIPLTDPIPACKAQ